MMKQIGRATGSLAVVALLLTACGGSGSKTLSEEDFVDELNSICKDADRAIRRIDSGDRNFFDDVLEVMQTSSDDLQKLQPPADLDRDFGDFVDNLDDQIKATEDLRDAVDNEDQDAIAAASDDLTNLAADSNDLADSLGADDCVDVGGGTTDTPGSVPVESTPNTPLPIDTAPPATAPPVTAPPATAPPVTAPPVTAPPATAAPPVMTNPTTNAGDGLAEDASTSWAPPAGWEWSPLDDLAGVGTPFGDPVLGPSLTNYWAGLIQNAATGGVALVYISENSGVWTTEQIEALVSFEGVSDGTTVTTPAGQTAVIATGVGDEQQLDLGLVLTAMNSVSIITPAGSDVAGILDAIVAANSMGG